MKAVLSLVGPVQLPASHPGPPVLDVELRVLVARHDDLRDARERVAIAREWPALRAAGMAALDQLEAACTPAPLDLIEAWMDKVVLSVRNPPNDAARLMRVAMVADTCRDLPAFVWTGETRRLFAQRGPDAAWWPSDAEVYQFLLPMAAKTMRQRDVLRVLVDADKAVAAEAERLAAAARAGDTRTAAAAAAVHGVLGNLTGKRHHPGGPLVFAPRRAAVAVVREPPRPSYLAGEALAARRAARGVKPLHQPPKGDA